MSDVPQGPGWWQASDLRWYPPEARPGYPQVAQPGYGSPVGPYGPGGFGYAPVLPSVQNQAVASLVLGILGVVPCCWPFNAVLGLVGLPLGVAALLRINRGQARDDGKGVAIAGIVISSLAILAAIVILVLVFATETTQYGLIEPGVGG